MIPAASCLDANTLVAFASGELPADRRSAVEMHLDGCPSCAELLREAMDGLDLSVIAAPTAGPPAPSATVAYMRADIDRDDDLPRGSVIGRYIILATIGQGGLGRVYAAYDPELDRQVALKLLRRADQDAEQRLLREARAMAKLSHPNVVPVHDVGASDRGPFIAMNLVGGGDLHQWLKTGPRRWQDIRDKLVWAGQGLAAAHRAGLVHRDFKAGNVLLDDGRVMVTDFGLARQVSFAGSIPGPHPNLSASAAATADPQLTRTGELMGTPGYIPPESFRGFPWDARSDQFSFCVTAFVALFGVYPFPRDFIPFVAAVEAGRIAAVPRETAVPTWLRRAIERGLSASPAARHPTMEALLTAMTRDRRVRRRWWGGIASTLLAGGLAAGVTLTLVEPEPTSAQRDAVQSLIDDARRAASASYFVYPPAEDPDSPTAFRKVLELEALDGGAAGTARSAAEELRQEFAATLVRLGDEYWSRPGGIPFAAEYYAAALVFAPDHPRALERMVLTPTELALLRERAADGDFTRAELTAAELLAALAEPNDDTRRERLATLLGSQEIPLLAQARLEQVLDAQTVAEVEDRARTRSRRRRAEPRTARASAPAPADPVPSESAAPAEDDTTPAVAEATRPADPKAAKAAVERGRAAIRSNDMKAAESEFLWALQHDPHRAAAYAGLAEVYFETQRSPKALTHAKAAVRRAPRVAQYRMLLGDILLKMVDLQGAREQYVEARSLGHPAAAARIAKVDEKLAR